VLPTGLSISPLASERALGRTKAPLAVQSSVTLSATLVSQTITAPPELAQATPAETASVQISGASLANLTQALEQAFSAKFPQTSLSLATDSTDAALKKLLAGKIDLAAIGRPLTEAEQQAGLVATPIARNKIAVVVGKDNAFNGSLTDVQFAKIFRGEITNWADVGGRNSAIRVVDRPAQDDVRQAFRTYPVFKTAPFQAASTATSLTDTAPADLVKALGKNGISFAVADQVLQNPDLKVLRMHKTLPTDARYPFSQPLLYVHKGNPSSQVKAFLDFAQDPANRTLIEQARIADAVSPVEASAVAAGASPNPATASGQASTKSATTSTRAGSEPESAGSVPAANPSTATPVPWWPWLALPLGGLLWWLLKRNRADGPFQQLPDSSSSVTPTPAGSSPPSVNGSTSNAVADPTAPRPAPASAPSLITESVTESTESATELAPGLANGPSDISPQDRPTAVPNGHSAGYSADAAPASAYYTAPATAHATSAAETASPGIEGGEQLGTTASTGEQAVAQGGSQLAEPFLAEAADLRGNSVGVASDAVDQNRDCRVVFVPRAADRAYVAWEVGPDKRAALQQDGQKLIVRIHDVTNLDLEHDPPHDTQEYDCDDTQQDMDVVIPVDQRDYLAELGYRTSDYRWLRLVRSAPIHISAEQSA
jgi:phosphate transport system substrate-binding protein